MQGSGYHDNIPQLPHLHIVIIFVYFCIYLLTLFLLALQHNLYPTVGLQTPGEVVDTNFGKSPFVFDFKSVLQVSTLLININIITGMIENIN